MTTLSIWGDGAGSEAKGGRRRTERWMVDGGIRPDEKIYVEEGTQLEHTIFLQIVEQAQIIRKY